MELSKEKRRYYVDENNNVYDGETSTPADGWKEKTWQEVESILSKQVSRPQRIETELIWQKEELKKVENTIYSYQQDLTIPDVYSDLKVTSFTEGEYYSLLEDRKLLADYILQDNFPECDRPLLSGLANAHQTTS